VERHDTPETDIFQRFLSMQLSRRTLFKAAGAAGAGLMLAEAGLLRAAAAADDTIQAILDITVTVEHFGVTFLGTAIDNIKQGKFSKPVPAPVLAVLEAARGQEQFHIDFFKQAGGTPLTTTFTLPDPALVTDYDKFFKAIVDEEARETALGIAAMQVFTAMRRPDLVKVMFQYAAEESEHRLLANYALGARAANNKGFAPALYVNASDIVADLRKVGIIGGSGPAITYPGPGQIDPTNVIERVPGGVVIDCTASTPAPMPGLPNTGGGGGTNGSGTVATLGVLGLGVATVGALVARRGRAAATPATGDAER